VWELFNQRKLNKILANQEKILANQEEMKREARLRFDTIDAVLRDILLRCSNPGLLRISITGEDPMADKILFQVVLPPKSAPDVVRRELTVSFADGSQDVIELSADATSSDTLKGDQDSEISVSLVDIDDAGNRSEPSLAAFELLDTVAPPAPGELGLSIVGEETETVSEG
jgi:hypothetical protein